MEKEYQQNIGQYFDNESESKTAPFKWVDEQIAKGMMTVAEGANYLKSIVDK